MFTTIVPMMRNIIVRLIFDWSFMSVEAFDFSFYYYSYSYL